MSLATQRPASVKNVQVRQAGDPTPGMIERMVHSDSYVADWYNRGRYQKGHKVIKGTKMVVTFPVPRFPNRLAELAFMLESKDSWHDRIHEREMREKNGL